MKSWTKLLLVFLLGFLTPKLFSMLHYNAYVKADRECVLELEDRYDHILRSKCIEHKIIYYKYLGIIAGYPHIQFGMREWGWSY